MLRAARSSGGHKRAAADSTLGFRSAILTTDGELFAPQCQAAVHVFF
jgi:hypothetical protein